MTDAGTETTLDIGCGPNKRPGSVGVDIHPYPGVDVVTDLNQTPWPLEAGRFDRIVCSHVIEHVADLVVFFRELHRVARPGALVEVVTPHFSSIDSWTDPTHRWHLATLWYQDLLPGGYLAEQMGSFEWVSSSLTFGKSMRSVIPRLIIRWFGYSPWEKNLAFVYPARNIETVLRVLKQES